MEYVNQNNIYMKSSKFFSMFDFSLIVVRILLKVVRDMPLIQQLQILPRKRTTEKIMQKLKEIVHAEGTTPNCGGTSHVQEPAIDEI